MDTSKLQELLPVIVPLLLLQAGLMAGGLISLYRKEQVRFGRKWLWALIIICVNLVGPVLFFLFGEERRDLE